MPERYDVPDDYTVLYFEDASRALYDSSGVSRRNGTFFRLVRGAIESPLPSWKRKGHSSKAYRQDPVVPIHGTQELPANVSPYPPWNRMNGHIPDTSPEA